MLVRAGTRKDQCSGLVTDRRACSFQGGPADPEVVTAQQQVNWMRTADGGRHYDGDDRPGRAAAGTDCNTMRPARQQIVELAGIRAIAVRKPALHSASVTSRRRQALGSLVPERATKDSGPGRMGAALPITAGADLASPRSAMSAPLPLLH